MTDVNLEIPATKDKGPGVFMKPPKLYGLALLCGFIIDLALPFGIFEYWAQFFLGILFIGGGVVLAAWSIHLFSAAGTNVPTDKPATALVTTGPYRHMRNPIYVGLTALYAGTAILFDWPAALALLLPVLYLMNKKVIAREEEYLAAKFGDDYLKYKNAVKRWGIL